MSADGRPVDAPTFYDGLAADYDRQFDAPHRRAYDDLAWDRVTAAIGDEPGVVIDVGCGGGRWSRRLVALGHRVIGIDPSPAMVAQARARALGDRFAVGTAGVETADLAPDAADAVVAMGSIQYAEDPRGAIARMAGWLRPGGTLAVLCDSRLALALELVAADRLDEAVERARTGEAEYVHDGRIVAHRLFDAAGLRAAFVDAGLVDVEVTGLLVSWSAHGRDETVRRLREDPEGQTGIEARLAACTELADAGKQLMAIGRRQRSPQ